eukprot:74596-Ditylum_brightwellii.AAC.1
MEEVVESAGRKLKRTVLRQKKDSFYYDKWRLEAERASIAIAEENAAAATEEKSVEIVIDKREAESLNDNDEESYKEHIDDDGPMEKDSQQNGERLNYDAMVDTNKTTLTLHQVPLKKVTPVIVCEEPVDSFPDGDDSLLEKVTPVIVCEKPVDSFSGGDDSLSTPPSD